MILSFRYHLDRLTLTMTFWGSYYRPVVPSHKLKESITATIFNLFLIETLFDNIPNYEKSFERAKDRKEKNIF